MSKETQIHEKFFNVVECDEILNFAKEHFEIDGRTRYGWYARTNRNLDFENKIAEKIKLISPLNPYHISWINLTEYEDNRSLDLHTDERSDYTFCITLTEGYEGGSFIIEDKKYTTLKGDCIIFDGHNLKHGVEPVTKGYRASLNIWIKGGQKPMI
jgi:hypothetical protein